jgi:hypothetical protein
LKELLSAAEEDSKKGESGYIIISATNRIPVQRSLSHGLPSVATATEAHPSYCFTTRPTVLQDQFQKFQDQLLQVVCSGLLVSLKHGQFSRLAVFSCLLRIRKQQAERAESKAQI